VVRHLATSLATFALLAFASAPAAATQSTGTGGTAPAAVIAPAASSSTWSAVARTPVQITLTEMAIRTSTSIVPSGPVTFVVQNAGTVTHEVVVIRTDLPHGLLPADPSAPGKVLETGSAGESGDIDAGATTQFTLTLAPGRYALICNQPGHYAAGMHVAFTVASLVEVELTEMAIAADQTSVPAGPVVFLVHNAGTVTHELVLLHTNTAIDGLPANPQDAGKVQELGWWLETGDMDAGLWSSREDMLPAGNYLLICNQPGHYKAGMRIAFTVK